MVPSIRPLVCIWTTVSVFTYLIDFRPKRTGENPYALPQSVTILPTLAPINSVPTRAFHSCDLRGFRKTFAAARNVFRNSIGTLENARSVRLTDGDGFSRPSAVAQTDSVVSYARPDRIAVNTRALFGVSSSAIWLPFASPTVGSKIRERPRRARATRESSSPRLYQRARARSHVRFFPFVRRPTKGAVHRPWRAGASRSTTV